MTPSRSGQFLVYQTQDGKLKIDVRFEGETVWLTQQQMADLSRPAYPTSACMFGTSSQKESYRQIQLLRNP
jgi:hypothetical protein